MQIFLPKLVFPKLVPNFRTNYVPTFSVRAALLNRIPPYLNFSFEYHFGHHNMLEVLKGGLLYTAMVPGTEGASYSYNRYLIDLRKYFILVVIINTL